jgi:hypothetical protein
LSKKTWKNMFDRYILIQVIRLLTHCLDTFILGMRRK